MQIPFLLLLLPGHTGPWPRSPEMGLLVVLHNQASLWTVNVWSGEILLSAENYILDLFYNETIEGDQSNIFINASKICQLFRITALVSPPPPNPPHTHTHTKSLPCILSKSIKKSYDPLNLSTMDRFKGSYRAATAHFVNHWFIWICEVIQSL